MINIIFIYLCFWVFISSCFIRWVVGLNCPPKLSKTERDLLSDKCNELELTKQKLSNSLSKCEKLTKEVQRLQLEEVKSYENLKEDKALFLEKIKLEKELIDKEIKTIQSKPKSDKLKLYGTHNEIISYHISNYEKTPLGDNDILDKLYDKFNNDSK